MIYTYCKNSLMFKKIRFKTYLKVLLIFSLMFLTASYYMYTIGIKNTFESIPTEEKILLIKESDQFTKEKMVTMLQDLNVKFPWIPMAQSIIETGYWRSDIFLENNNLFGMKKAKSRITTATGTNKNHATYKTWRESVYDYAFYQSRYLGKVGSEEQYFQFLSASYAEDTTYISKLKNIIESQQLKQLFK